MPLIEFICPECGYTAEELTSVDEKAPICKNCGARMTQKYWGKIYVNKRMPEHCSGNCSTCKGCGK